MSPYELKTMEKSGRWEVESHGRDSHDWYYVDEAGEIGHFFSNRLWLEAENRIETEEEFRERIKYDLSNAKLDLENALGKTITSFAFPFNDYGRETVNYPKSQQVLAEEVSKIYQFAFYQVDNSTGETFNYPSDSTVMMKRIEPTGDWSSDYLLAVLESGISKDLPYTSDYFANEWIREWGEALLGEGLTLKAATVTTGASTALNGSWWWRDYTFSADVTWENGSNVVLIARRGDDNNYFGCNFERDKIYVKTEIDGVSHNLIDKNYSRCR
jgi:hypothetical protein